MATGKKVFFELTEAYLLQPGDLIYRVVGVQLTTKIVRIDPLDRTESDYLLFNVNEFPFVLPYFGHVLKVVDQSEITDHIKKQVIEQITNYKNQ